MSVLQDCLSRHETLAELAAGELTMASRIAQAFGLHGLERRTAAPHKTDLELARDEPTNLRQRTELLILQLRLGDIHDSLRRAGR
jgi:hypothetical protein